MKPFYKFLLELASDLNIFFFGDWLFEHFNRPNVSTSIYSTLGILADCHCVLLFMFIQNNAWSAAQ